MKKLLLACFALTLVLCLLPTTAEAATESGFTYEISDGKATITDYYGSGGNVTIPSTLGGCPVTTIGDNAFQGCTGLTAVTIPDSVTTIGTLAFWGCTGLTSVTIPDSVTFIGNGVFWNCTGLTAVTIPDSVTTIWGNAFDNCTGLTGVYITDLAAWCAIDFENSRSNPLSYAKNLYLNGSLVTELIIPDSVTTIGSYAFYDCDGLTAVTIGDSVTIIEGYAFYNCTGLTAVTIGDSVTTIGNRAFSGCTGLTSVTIPDSVTTIEGNAFSGCTALEEITIPVSMFFIADDAFKDVPLKTVHYGGTKEQWEKIDLNNNVCFAAAEVKTTEKPADPSEPTDPSTPTEPEKANHTICLVAIIALSVALAGSITLNLLQHKKKKA